MTQAGYTPSNEPLPADYFNKYAKEEDGKDIAYGKHWDANIYNEYDILHATDVVLNRVGLFKQSQYRCDTLLDVGAATGALMKRFEDKYGIQTFGVESAPWAKKHVLPEFKNKIMFEDWFAVAEEFGDNSYDLVVDCISMYIPPDHVPLYISQLARIAKKAVIPILCYKENADDYYPDPWRLSTRSQTWWASQFKREPGFGCVESFEDIIVAIPKKHFAKRGTWKEKK